MVKIYGVKLIDDLQFLEMRSIFQACLPPEVCKAVKKIKFPAGIQRKILGSLMLRAILYRDFDVKPKDIKIGYTEKDKPYLLSHPNIHFNISHSGNWVVFAFSSKKVGIDIEKVKKINFGIAKRFYSDEEQKQLFLLNKKKQLDYFFDLWTLKESYLKALGTGLTKSLSSFTVRLTKGNYSLHEDGVENTVVLKQLFIDRDYKLSVCCFEENIKEDVSVLYINDLLEILQVLK